MSSSAATRTVTGEENQPSSPEVPDAATVTVGAVVSSSPGSTVPPTWTVAVRYAADCPSARPSTVNVPSAAYCAGSTGRQFTGVQSPPTRTASGSTGAVPTGVATSTSGSASAWTA